MARILVVANAPSDNTQRLFQAACRGVLACDAATLDARAPLEADSQAVFECDGIIIGTTENFAAMSGLIKDFFERIYYPCLIRTEALPVALYIRAGNDGEGTRQGVQRILTGLRWRLVQEPLMLRGPWQDSFVEEVETLGNAVAEGLGMGIF